MYEFWYNYIKPKYGEKAKLNYMDTDIFIVYIKTEEIYSYIEKMLKLDLILQLTHQTDCYLKEKTTK